jgi:DNA anti-recombination protein RmuC
VNSDIDDDRSPGVNNQILLLLKNICARLDTIDDRMGRLEDKVTEAIDTDRTSCRYGTEERTEIIEVVDNRIDDCITDLKVESHDILQELKEEVDDTLERLDNEASDKMDQLENEIDENTTKLVKQYLKEKLSNASLRVDGTVFLDI